MKLNKLLQLLRDNAQQRAEGAPAIRVEAAADVAHIYVYDVIDAWWGANAVGLIQALAAAGDKPVRLHINSPGGDVFEALAMSAAIAAHTQPVHAHVEGLAASAATGLALACADVAMTEGSLFMIHNSWTLGYGDKTELRATADLLEKVDIGIAATYTKRTGASAEQVNAWMDAETWFTAAEAQAAGFIQAIESASQQDASAQAGAARWNLSAYAHAPKLEQPAPRVDELAAGLLQASRNRLQLLGNSLALQSATRPI